MNTILTDSTELPGISSRLSSSHARAAVFLDRDGTLIHDRGWLRNPEDVVFHDDTFDALRTLQQVAELFIVTNQGGISRGMLTAGEAESVNQHILKCLEAERIHVRAVYTCPHHREDGCTCIKPNPFFALQAAAAFNISPECSIAVGDHPHDVEFARRFGGKGVYLLTGHGAKHRDGVPGDVTIARSLGDAVPSILAMLPAVPPNYIGASDAALAIRRGQVIAIPTETVYGMAANAFDETAVRQVFAIKARPALDPLIVHIADADGLDAVAASVPPAARTLAAAFWPGPLTLVLPKKPCIPDSVTAGLDTVAIRVPVHPIARKIIREAACPVAAPSANRFGTISPTCARHVFNQFGTELDGIVDGGPCAVGVESTILGFWENRVWLLRPGGIPLEALEAIAGPIAIYRQSGPDDIRAPGTMPRHYAPATPLILRNAGDPVTVTPRTGQLVFGPDEPATGDHLENLSPSGDPEEAAARLYAALRRLDAAGLDCIIARRLPESGLGRTVNDRLQRAATPGGTSQAMRSSISAVRE
jgi:L-threonylcarbamoyladenylate synthase